MTLAVILGLWCTLAPGVAGAGQTEVRPGFVQSQAAAPEPGSQESPKPSAPAPASPQTPAEAAPQTPPSDSAGQKPETATTPGATNPKKSTHKKKRAAKPAGTPKKVVVRNGSTSDPTVQLSPGLSKGQASNHIQDVNELLAGTEANLKQISGRTLNATQQDTVKQIHLYMEQARAAVEAGDLERGHNLAFKAHLLSDDLVKH